MTPLPSHPPTPTPTRTHHLCPMHHLFPPTHRRTNDRNHTNFSKIDVCALVTHNFSWMTVNPRQFRTESPIHGRSGGGGGGDGESPGEAERTEELCFILTLLGKVSVSVRSFIIRTCLRQDELIWLANSYFSNMCFSKKCSFILSLVYHARVGSLINTFITILFIFVALLVY